MTLFGKVLIIINLGLSIAMVAWALSIYSQRPDWSFSKGSGEQQAGVLAELDAKYQQARGMRTIAEGRYQTAAAKVLASEQQRRDLDAFYADALKKLRSGPGDLQTLVYLNGQLQTNPQNGQPVLQPFKDEDGMALKWLKFYEDELAAVQKAITQENQRLAMLLEEQKQISEEIDGPGGLRQRILREKENTRRAEEELRDLRPVELNARVEAQLLIKRQAQLMARVEELRRTLGIARR